MTRTVAQGVQQQRHATQAGARMGVPRGRAVQLGVKTGKQLAVGGVAEVRPPTTVVSVEQRHVCECQHELAHDVTLGRAVVTVIEAWTEFANAMCELFVK